MLPWLRSRYCAVRAVVDAVVGRGVEDRLGRAERPDGLGVDPELVEQVHAPGRGHQVRGDADQAQQPVGHGGAEGVGHRLAQGGRQVVPLARVVHHVDGPHVPALVHEAVVPVVDEVPRRRRPAATATGPAQVGEDRRFHSRWGVGALAHVVVTASPARPPWRPPRRPRPPGGPAGGARRGGPAAPSRPVRPPPGRPRSALGRPTRHRSATVAAAAAPAAAPRPRPRTGPDRAERPQQPGDDERRHQAPRSHGQTGHVSRRS